MVAEQVTASRVDRYNNFDFLRLLFALFVIISHSYDAYGLKEYDWLHRHTTQPVAFSTLGVSGFFIISGCLVFQSMQRSAGYVSFIWKRCLRIFPALVVMVLILALVIGGIVAGTPAYYTDKSPYTYILRGITIFNFQGPIRGVFEHNPYANIVNASLWTIPYEFFLYLLFFVFYLSRNAVTVVAKLLPVVFIAMLFIRWRYPESTYTIPFTSITTQYLVNLALYFVGGMMLSCTMKWWGKYKVWVAIAAGILLLLLFNGVFPILAVYIIWPIAVISFGSCKTPIISRLETIGDPSYGVYIWGWPIQQTLVFYLGSRLGFYQFMALSLVLSVTVGYLSWYGVEKHFLGYKMKAYAARLMQRKVLAADQAQD